MSEVLSDYDYSFPPEAVAQRPLADRSASRMMVLTASKRSWCHDRFLSLPGWLNRGDLLVINNTSVLPCRLFARKKTGGRVEILLLRKVESKLWQVWLRPGGGVREGDRLWLFSRLDPAQGSLAVTVQSLGPGETRIMFDSEPDAATAMTQWGEMPLPPYIKRPLPQPDDVRRYQTVFAKEPGAVAAPTAGLHFTSDIFSRLERKGIRIAEVTLHVGIGTFAPVRVERIDRHVMHHEFYAIPEPTRRALRRCREGGGRVVAVGTTALRAMESWAQSGKPSGWTDLFIRPGYQPRVVQDLLTNFHQPKSTLLMLVATWAGRKFVLQAYSEAIAAGYRLFSYGDCMLIRGGGEGFT